MNLAQPLRRLFTRVEGLHFHEPPEPKILTAWIFEIPWLPHKKAIDAMRKNVTFIELPIFAGVVPLASGYMEACCLKDPQLATSFSFEKLSLAVDTPYDQILMSLENRHSGVYAFSCYVWNSKLVRRLVSALVVSRPEAHFMLGGPQVMHQGVRYLSSQYENILVCNGEGERTFANFLRALSSPERDFGAVRNLSFYRNGELITTEPEPRISDLSELPSPFLDGLFEKNKYSWMLIETNRGCPFKCNYCYWGAATGAHVYKHNEERLRREIEWISQSKCWYLFIADANWGMLKRDVDLSRFIVECQKRYGSPISVYFCGSKNTPERVAEIARIFHDAGLISTQSVALQTMNPETLIRVNRDNIKTSAYTQIQQSLNQQEIASFVEMIWPLPGETLLSFQDGLANLCEIGADSFVVYPLLLMNNVDLTKKQQEYRLVTVPDASPSSEAEMVIGTAEVNADDYREGVHYIYAVLSLYVLRGLWHLGRYLNSSKSLGYRDLFRAFVEFAKKQSDDPWTFFCQDSIRRFEHVTFSNTGSLVHLILHSNREAFDDLLQRFVATQKFWADPLARFLFEVDLIHRPYVYRNTPILFKRYRFTQLQILGVFPKGYLVEIPSHYVKHMSENLKLGYTNRIAKRFEVVHKRSQLPFVPAKSMHEHFMYCQDMTQRMTAFLPLWREVAAASVASSAVMSQ